MFQEKALAIMKSGKNVFLTGSAGAGKTYTLNQYIAYLKKHKVPVAVTASTGIAATHMNGTTIHSWTGIGIKDQLSHNDLRSLSTKQYLMKAIEKTHVLIIDEISMLHLKQLDMVNQVLKYLRKNPAPFGGMQVIFAGDFFQLPPVSRNNESNRERFAFMSRAWQEARPVVCYLTEQYRQTKNSLNTILNELRAVEVSQTSIELLQETKFSEPAIEPTRLYTHNTDVDEINKSELEALPGETEWFFAEKKGNYKLLESFVKSLIVQEKLGLKKEARVMFLKNNHEMGVMNGTLGIVKDFDPENNWPLVQVSDGRTLTVEPEKWAVNNEKGNPLVQFIQVPLRLAWAITIHKSQGMTLEAAEIDLGKTFERGQGYVALSRLKDIEGLRLLGLNRLALEVDGLAAKADARFRELSVEAEDQYSEEALEPEFKGHIHRSGGTTDKKEMAKTTSLKKGDTYKITADLIGQGKSLADIAEQRGLTEGTLKGHLLSIVERYPSVDISRFRPADKQMKMIEQACRELLKNATSNDLQSNGFPKLSVIFNKLNKKVDYADIKLALAFIMQKKEAETE